MLRNKDILFPELSYQIMGCAFEVYNTLGAGLLEKQYQKALALEFKQKGISFTEQAYYPVEYKGTNIGKGYMDFLVDEKIVVELKRGDNFSRNHIQQVISYLNYSVVGKLRFSAQLADGIRNSSYSYSFVIRISKWGSEPSNIQSANG